MDIHNAEFVYVFHQAKPLLKKNEVKSLVDPSLGDEYNTRQMNLVLLVASACIQQSSIRRPSMNQVCSVCFLTNKPKAVAYEAFGKFHKIKHVKQDEMLIMVFLGGTTFEWRS